MHFRPAESPRIDPPVAAAAAVGMWARFGGSTTFLPHRRYSTRPGRGATPNPADALGLPDAGRTARSVSVIA